MTPMIYIVDRVGVAWWTDDQSTLQTHCISALVVRVSSMWRFLSFDKQPHVSQSWLAG
jgi:hypothetical protein